MAESAYPSNRIKDRKVETQPEPVVKKAPVVQSVVEGKVTRRKKSLAKRGLEKVMGGDTNTVSQYVLEDVLLPAFRAMVVDGIVGAAERAFYGESRPGGRGRGAGSYTSYGSRYSNAPSEPRREMSSRARARHDFDEVLLDTRVEAEEVINRMFDQVERYGTATVANLYSLIGQSASHVDSKWGWTERTLAGAGVSRDRGGLYALNLPAPEPID